MQQKNKTMKGFTLMELLLVVALIAILSTIILMQLNTGRERAEVNRYLAYGTQMHRLVADSVAAGQFDKSKTNFSSGDMMCLGDVGYDCGPSAPAVTDDNDIYKALTYLTKMPETTKDNAFSPYDKNNGIYMVYKPVNENNNFIRIMMWLMDSDIGNNASHLQKVCKSIGWGVTDDFCYIDIPLPERL